MDKINMKLLYELNWNCRQTDTELGKKLRVSKQVVNYRVAQLEKNKIILGYNALIDWRKLGYNAIRVYIKWHNIRPEKEEEIYRHMKDSHFFMWTVKFEGEFDIGFYVWVQDIPTFAKYWYSFLSKYKKYILKEEIYESVNMVHYPMKPFIDKPKLDEKIIGFGSKQKYDETDYKILELITENARIPIVDIAHKVRLTPKAIIYRLKGLETKEIILGYNAFIDINKLGYRFYKVDFYLNDLSRINEMIEFAKQHKNIVYLMRTIGGPDYEIEVMVADVVELNNLIKEIRTRFSESIEHFRFHRFEYTIKQVYLPGGEINSVKF